MGRNEMFEQNVTPAWVARMFPQKETQKTQDTDPQPEAEHLAGLKEKRIEQAKSELADTLRVLVFVEAEVLRLQRVVDGEDASTYQV